MFTQEYKIEIIMILVASSSTIVTLILSFLFPEIQILLLTILTVWLSIVYQVGNIYVKESIRAKNEYDFSVLENVIEGLEDENEDLMREIEDN